MKYWMFILSLLSANAAGSIISFTWNGEMVNSSNERVNTSWRMSIDSETSQFTNIDISSAGFDISLAAPAPISMPWDPQLETYMGWSYAKGTGADGATWNIEMYEFWIPTQAQVTNPFEAIPSLEHNPPIFHLYLYAGDFADALYWGGHVSNFEVIPPTAAEVPEPTTLALLSMGLAGLVRRSARPLS